MSDLIFKYKKLALAVVIVGLVGAGAGLYVSFGPPDLYAKSGTPDFCVSCHVMESQYENWFHQGGHRRLKCIDCHLPNDNFVNHATWKGIDGMWDVVVFYSGRVPDQIKISEHGAAIIQDNCKRCHAETVFMINENRNCWTCHRRLAHRTSGAI